MRGYFERGERDFLGIGSKNARIDEAPKMLPFLVQLELGEMRYLFRRYGATLSGSRDLFS
jgi:hypothetical protein